MPESKTPVVKTSRPQQPHAAQDREVALPVDKSSEKTKGVIVLGSPGEIPRALEHPALSSGRLTLAAAVAVDVDDDEPRTMDGLSALLRTTGARTLLIAGPIGTGVMREVADLATVYQCDLLAVMPTEVLAEHQPVVMWTGDYPLVRLARARQTALETICKRALDLLGAALGLLLSAPLLVVLMIAIRLESKGPALFRHERVGRRGRRFLCLKLRTMHADAQDRLRADAAMYEQYRRHHFKIPDDKDPRVTRIGRFLRRTSLDELPQLWNVLRGEMSLVGPRPVVEEELELYGDAKDLVLSVRPGITGAWAVSGREQLGYPQRCETELNYVRDWSIRTDMTILARTAGVVILPGVKREDPPAAS